ncbi:hypothetical protein EI94DRAFT_1593867 [Lactarius quietus]|nr:hypothetical protein EI94DRAFT_1593867 [Lactarius quietus]
MTRDVTLGLELGQQDDLEALAHILIYFLCGHLPWQGLPSGSHIVKRKQQIKPSNLCCGLPAEFSTFLKYSCSLGFKDIPDYEYISDLFKGLLSREGFENVVMFDWDHANEEQPWDLVSNSQGVHSLDQHKHKQLPKQHEGYELFLFWTSYARVYVKLCLGCTPRHINVSILMTPHPCNPLP